MTEQEANQESEKYQTLVGKYFESNRRKDKYIVENIRAFENPFEANKFLVHVEFRRLDEQKAIIDSLNFFLNEYSQINHE